MNTFRRVFTEDVICNWQAMEKTMKADEKKFRFLIDGFPRNQDNLQGWNTEMDGKADVKFVLFFDCSNEVSSSVGFVSFFMYIYCTHILD